MSASSPSDDLLATQQPLAERKGRAAPEALALRRGAGAVPADVFASYEYQLDGGPLGTVRALRFWPDGTPSPAPRATVLHWHGGGFRLGRPEHAAVFAQNLATACDVEVICPHYRLAPEHPFPAALNDAMAALAGVLGGVLTGSLARGAKRIILSGDSAGGGLAASLAVLCGQRGIALAGQVLHSPWLDLAVTNPSYGANAARDPLFSAASAREAAEQYLQGNKADDPLASPLLADAAIFPPTYISVGDGEVLAGDALAFHAGLTAAGRSAHLSVIAGMEHVAVVRGAGLVGAEQTFTEACAFIRAIASAP